MPIVEAHRRRCWTRLSGYLSLEPPPGRQARAVAEPTTMAASRPKETRKKRRISDPRAPAGQVAPAQFGPGGYGFAAHLKRP